MRWVSLRTFDRTKPNLLFYTTFIRKIEDPHRTDSLERLWIAWEIIKVWIVKRKNVPIVFFKGDVACGTFVERFNTAVKSILNKVKLRCLVKDPASADRIYGNLPIQVCPWCILSRSNGSIAIRSGEITSCNVHLPSRFSSQIRCQPGNNGYLSSAWQLWLGNLEQRRAT